MTLTSATSERSLWFLGTRAVIRGRAPYVIEMHIPPMGSPPLHVHDAHADTFYLLEGEMAMRAGGSSFVASPGSYVAVPSGVAHTFRVTSAVPAHLVVIHDDPSFLELVEDLGTTSPTVQTAEEIVAAHERHHTRLIGPSMPEEEAWEIVGHGPQPAPFGSVHHVSVVVSDVARSEAWYRDALGFVSVDGSPDEGHLVMLNPLNGVMVALGAGPIATVEHIAFGVRSRHELIEWQSILDRRGAAPGTITDAPYGSGFVVRDPDGIELEMFSPPTQ